ncbi:MAG: SBBP repeat-containing protein [bacterium]
MKRILSIFLLVPPIYWVLPIAVLFDQHSLKTYYFNVENGNAAYRVPDEKQTLLFGGIEEAWVRHYSSGLAPSFDVAVDIAIDSSGNAYVAGYSSNRV